MFEIVIMLTILSILIIGEVYFAIKVYVDRIKVYFDYENRQTMDEIIHEIDEITKDVENLSTKL